MPLLMGLGQKCLQRRIIILEYRIGVYAVLGVTSLVV